jgi:putative nucleotidyltransferase with HDIG domain
MPATSGELTISDAAEPKLPEAVAATLEERIREGSLELPVLPDAAAEIVSQTSRADCDFKIVAELIRRDQAMATHLLRIANSPLYRPRTQIVSVQHALSRLGTSAVREIALLISVKTRTFQADGFGPEVKLLFRHSLGTAIFAQEIARMRRLNVDEAFLCGLLHDVGRPVLLQTLVDLSKALRLTPEKAAIEAAATLYHGRVGEQLVRRWSLPEAVAKAILHHHDISDDVDQTTMITALADVLAHSTLDDRIRDETAVRSHFALPHLTLYPEDVDKLLALRERVVEIAASLG